MPPLARTTSALVTEKAVLASSARNDGRGPTSVIATVRSSTASSDAIGSARNDGCARTFLSRLKENTTSSAVSGSPLVNVTSSRKVKV